MAELDLFTSPFKRGITEEDIRRRIPPPYREPSLEGASETTTTTTTTTTTITPPPPNPDEVFITTDWRVIEFSNIQVIDYIENGATTSSKGKVFFNWINHYQTVQTPIGWEAIGMTITVGELTEYTLTSFTTDIMWVGTNQTLASTSDIGTYTSAGKWDHSYFQMGTFTETTQVPGAPVPGHDIYILK